MVWKCPPLHLLNWNNLWKWKDNMINEHDIADHECALYELHRGDKFIFDGNEGPFFFDHLDGMYSYCKDDHGTLFHFAAWTKVKKL